MNYLENDIIKLRALEPEDLDIMYRWENTTELWSIGNTCEPYSKYILKEYIAYSNKTVYEKKQLRLMIESRGETVGCIDLYDFSPEHLRAGIGILIDKKYQRQGIAHNALEVLKKYSFDFLHIHQLYAYIPCKNKSSIALFQKSGFEQAGCLKDWILTINCFEDVYLYSFIKK